METKQVNLTVPENLLKQAETYAASHGFRNIQELAAEALREKVFGDEYDETLNEKEAKLIDELLELSISKGKIKSEKELNSALEGS